MAIPSAVLPGIELAQRVKLSLAYRVIDVATGESKYPEKASLFSQQVGRPGAVEESPTQACMKASC